MTTLDDKINASKNRLMDCNRELLELLVERDNVEGFMKVASFMIAGAMATLHPVLGQRMTYETILAILDQMGTTKIPDHLVKKAKL